VNHESVREFLTALNDTWQRGDVDALNAYYHADVVLLPPDLGEPIRGRDAVVGSYRDFLDSARLNRFQTLDLTIFSFPGTEIAHLTFEVDYTLDGARYLEKGLEVYTVLETNDGLQIVWRQQSVLDSRLAEKSDPR